MTTAPMHEVKPAAAVIADDVICQSFIQSSSTLAYACLLIRQRKFDLAAHVLHSLEAKQASRFKDMVFYLQAQIGIETGEFAMVKKRMVPRVNQHPNDMVALSLLGCCVYHEFSEWETEHPAPPQTLSPALPESPSLPDAPLGSPFGNAQAASAAAYAATFDGASAADTPVPASPSVLRPPPAAVPDLIELKLNALPPELTPSAVPMASAVRPAPAAAPIRSAAPVRGAADADLGMYQSLAGDPNLQALAMWNKASGKAKTVCRNPELETMMAALPRELPGAVQTACSALDSGPVHKICFSFQTMTATTFHASAENMALITGNINQSLLTIVRAENTFRKAAANAPASSLTGMRSE